MVQRVSVLGVPIDILTQIEVLKRIATFCRSSGQFHIATPNPEMLVEAKKNAGFQKVLQGTALNLPDGAGLVWALRLRHGIRECRASTQGKLPPPTVERVTGIDTLLAICSARSRICPPETVFLLGALEGVGAKAAEILKQRNPHLNIVGTFAGSPKQEDENEVIKRVAAASPTLLFVAFGAPAQDLWIARNLSRMPSVKVAMGIGGALDFIAGKKKRAPKIFQNAHLEWLWRLILEPRRFRRIWKAVVVFPSLILFTSMRDKDRESYT